MTNRNAYPDIATYRDIAEAAVAAPVDDLVRSAAFAVDVFGRMHEMGVLALPLDWQVDVDRVQDLARLVRNATEDALAGQLTLGQIAKREQLAEYVKTTAQTAIDAKHQAVTNGDHTTGLDLAHQTALLLKLLAARTDTLDTRVLNRMEDVADALADRAEGLVQA